MGKLAPSLAAIASQAHEGTVAIPDALLVAEPTRGCDAVKFELLTLDKDAHGSGILVAESRHPLRLPGREAAPSRPGTGQYRALLPP